MNLWRIRMGAEIIRIISLSYNIIIKSSIDVTDGDISISLYKSSSDTAIIQIRSNENSEGSISLLLEKTFRWGDFKINYLDLLDVYKMDYLTIILILSKKVLNHNLMDEDIDQTTLKMYSKVVDILTKQLQSLK